jgi:class 3 adenylate cyclase
MFQHIVANSLPNLVLEAVAQHKMDKETVLKRFPNPMGHPILTIPAEEVQRWTIFKSREYFQKITKFAILKDGVFGYHNYQGKDDKFEVVLGIAPGKGLQREFLSKWEVTDPSIQPPTHFAALSLHEDSIWYNYGKSKMSQTDFASVYIQMTGRFNEFISVSLNGLKGYAMLIPSEVIGGIYYFYFEEEKALLEEEMLYRDQVGYLWFLFVVCSAWLVYWLKGVFLNPVKTMEVALRRLREGNLDLALKVHNGDELSQVCAEFNLLAQEMQHRERMLPFVSVGLLNVLKEAALKPEGLSGPAVVMFSDIRSFTTLCENHAPEEVVLMLNEYFEIWQQAVNRYGGLVDRFVGDAIRVVLREEVVPYPALQSLAIATEVLRRLEAWNSQRQIQGKFTIRIGIGIAMGLIHLNVIKGKNKFEFLLSGTCVHESELLESLSKYTQHKEILLSDSIAEVIQDQFEILPFYHEDLDSNRLWWQVVKL